MNILRKIWSGWIGQIICVLLMAAVGYVFYLNPAKNGNMPEAFTWPQWVYVIIFVGLLCRVLQLQSLKIVEATPLQQLANFLRKKATKKPLFHWEDHKGKLHECRLRTLPNYSFDENGNEVLIFTFSCRLHQEHQCEIIAAEGQLFASVSKPNESFNMMNEGFPNDPSKVLATREIVFRDEHNCTEELHLKISYLPLVEDY